MSEDTRRGWVRGELMLLYPGMSIEEADALIDKFDPYYRKPLPAQEPVQANSTAETAIPPAQPGMAVADDATREAEGLIRQLPHTHEGRNSWLINHGTSVEAKYLRKAGKKKRRIYVASSWRNDRYPHVVRMLRKEGHEVYDFRNPPNKTAFRWEDIDPHFKSWSADEYIHTLEHPRAVAGYDGDMAAMEWADTCVLVLPSGRSAHLEAGWFAAHPDKRLIILTRDGEEPELMARMADLIVVSLDQLVRMI